MNRVNPYDLYSVAKVTMKPKKKLSSLSFRSADVMCCGGPNSSASERVLNSKKRLEA